MTWNKKHLERKKNRFSFLIVGQPNPLESCDGGIIRWVCKNLISTHLWLLKVLLTCDLPHSKRAEQQRSEAQEPAQTLLNDSKHVTKKPNATVAKALPHCTLLNLTLNILCQQM